MRITLDADTVEAIDRDRIVVDVVMERAGVPIAGQLIVDATLARALATVGEKATAEIAAARGSGARSTQPAESASNG